MHILPKKILLFILKIPFGDTRSYNFFYIYVTVLAFNDAVTKSLKLITHKKHNENNELQDKSKKWKSINTDKPNVIKIYRFTLNR